jgi:hypothetical protein
MQRKWNPVVRAGRESGDEFAALFAFANALIVIRVHFILNFSSSFRVSLDRMKPQLNVCGHHRTRLAGLFTLLVLSLAAFSQAADPPQTSSSAQYGYSVQFPAAWHKVSEASVQTTLAAAAQRDPAKRGVIWDAVFQRPVEGKAGVFGYPYVLCQVTPYPAGKRLGEDEIAAAVKAMSAMNLTSGPNSITVPAARYDPATHTAWQPREMTGPAGAFKGLSIMHYGSKAMVAIMCYDQAASYEANKAEFDQVEASFKFDAAAAYGPPDAGGQHLPAAALIQTGELDLTFTQRSPLSSRKELATRLTMKEAEMGADYDLAQRPFKAYVPLNYDPAVPHGVFVYLGYKDAVSVPQAWEPALDKAHIIFITPVNHHGDDFPNSIPSWQMMGLALDAVHHLKQHYNIDERRVYRMSKGTDSMRFALASADVFSGFVVTGDDTWFERVTQPDRRTYAPAFPPPPAHLLHEARRRAFILATELWGSPESLWHVRTPAMKRIGFEHVLELKLTWLGDLHYPMMKVEWLESSALPFLDSIATAPGTRSAPARIATPLAPATTPAAAPAPPPATATPAIPAPASPANPAVPAAAAPNADAQHLLTMAELYISSKQTKRAREKLETLLRHYPNDPVAAKAKELLSTLPGE